MAGALALTGRDVLAAWLTHLAQERRCRPRTLESYGAALRALFAFLRGHRGERADPRRPGRGDGRRPARLSRLPPSGRPAAVAAFAVARPCRRSAPSTAGSTGGMGSRTPRSPWCADRGSSPACRAPCHRGPRLRPDRRGRRRPRPRALGGRPRRGGADPALRLRPADLRGAVAEAVAMRRWPTSLRITGKGGKTRIVPVLPQVRAAVDAYLAARPSAWRPTSRCSGPSAAARSSPRHVQALMQRLRGAPGPARQRHAARPAPRLRHPSAGRGRGPAHDSGAARPRLAVDDPEVHRGRRRRPAQRVRVGAPAGVGTACAGVAGRSTRRPSSFTSATGQPATDFITAISCR